jgi:hypothetical protein
MNFHLQLGMLSGPSAPPPIPPLPPTSARIVPPVKPKSKELTPEQAKILKRMQSRVQFKKAEKHPSTLPTSICWTIVFPKEAKNEDDNKKE